MTNKTEQEKQQEKQPKRSKAAKKPVTVTLTMIRQSLKSCQFNPKTPGPMKVIADIGNKDYYLVRALECITAAKGTGVGRRLSKEHTTKAIQLLALALVTED